MNGSGELHRLAAVAEHLQHALSGPLAEAEQGAQRVTDLADDHICIKAIQDIVGRFTRLQRQKCRAGQPVAGIGGKLRATALSRFLQDQYLFQADLRRGFEAFAP